MIELSNNEAASLVKLAARGVGYPWGVCEEAAHISHWFAERQLPGVELFSVLFAWVDEQELSQLVLQLNDNRWSCHRDQLCPLFCGSAIIDSASSLLNVDNIELINVVCPMLLLPFISEASVMLEKPIRVSWKEGELVVNCTSIQPVEGDVEQLISANSLDSIFINLANDSSNSQLSSTDSNVDLNDAAAKQLWSTTFHSRVTIELNKLSLLKQYAHRTYAPATEESRLSGAGAGTSDND